MRDTEKHWFLLFLLVGGMVAAYVLVDRCPVGQHVENIADDGEEPFLICASDAP